MIQHPQREKGLNGVELCCCRYGLEARDLLLITMPSTSSRCTHPRLMTSHVSVPFLFSLLFGCLFLFSYFCSCICVLHMYVCSRSLMVTVTWLRLFGSVVFATIAFVHSVVWSCLMGSTSGIVHASIRTVQNLLHWFFGCILSMVTFLNPSDRMLNTSIFLFHFDLDIVTLCLDRLTLCSICD